MLLDRAVINSGPLVALSLAGRLDLLPALFGEFWIPEPVFREVVLAGVGRPGASALADARWAAHVCPAPTPDPLLIAELDPGEAAVIALARSVVPCLASSHQCWKPRQPRSQSCIRPVPSGQRSFAKAPMIPRNRLR